MGNAEARALTQSSPIVRDAVLQAHRNFMMFNRDYSLDKAAFANLFDPTMMPFQLVDQLFASFDIDGTGLIDFATLAVGLCAGAAALSLSEKLDILFDAIDINGDAELTLAEVHTAMGRFLRAAVVRVRGGEPATDGRVAYVDRRCTGCREVPVNVSYECVECRRGFALGVPITVHLCKDCAPTWEGCGSNAHAMRHTRRHTLVRSFGAPNPHAVTHLGFRCDGCDQNPIVGVRYRCLDCLDLVNLCEGCHCNGEEPLGHRITHRVELVTRSPSVDDEVRRFIAEVFTSSDANADGRVSRTEFLQWGRTSELAGALLSGFEVQHVKFSAFAESSDVHETTASMSALAAATASSAFSQRP